MAEDAVYTAARDKLLKKWKPTKTGDKWELTLELEIPLPDTCWSMLYYGVWLFCGLGDGRIRAFSKDGRDVTLTGHSKRVGVLLVHQDILLSGSSDGSIRCWQAQEGNPQAFGCTHSIASGLPDAISCMSVLNEALWVGGTSGVTLVDLSQMRAARDIQP